MFQDLPDERRMNGDTLGQNQRTTDLNIWTLAEARRCFHKHPKRNVTLASVRPMASTLRGELELVPG